MPADPWIILGALGAEAAVGYPDRLHRVIPHPVVWIGNLIITLERTGNLPEYSDRRRRVAGVLTLILAVGVAATAGWLIQQAPPPDWATAVLVIAVGTLGLAQRSLYNHVAAIAAPLARGELPAARAAVAMIVGRDTDSLDETGVAVAGLESLAESFNDGVVAPAFWFLVGGLPGLFAYKAINTADSIIGHREPRWRMFGWAAARTDDIANLIPARIAGGLIALAGGRGWKTLFRDAGKHASPNAGWPEAAMAGALGVRLGGAVRYDGVLTERPAFGDGAAPTAADLRRGLRVYLVACALLWTLFALGGLAWRL